jgi:hypothetical protein
MWRKIKFGAQIFVTDVMSKFVGKISRRTSIGQHSQKQERKTIGCKGLLRNGSKVPKRGDG